MHNQIESLIKFYIQYKEIANHLIDYLYDIK